MLSETLKILLGPVAVSASVFVSAILGVFFYWRAARRELVDNQTIFDTVVAFFLGAFIVGRVVDFLVRPDFYSWSFKKLVFFNAFWGFDVYGAALGGVVALWLYLRLKRDNFWDILDFAVVGLSFGLFFYFALDFLRLAISRADFAGSLSWAAGYLAIFWAVKRLSKQKRHGGFFANVFLVMASAISLVLVFWEDNFEVPDTWWPVAFLVFVFLVSLFNWYMLSKRKLFSDIKSFFGATLLFIFKTIRIFTNIGEADNTARAVVLSPFYLVKGAYFLVKYLGREIYMSFVDIVHAFGVKR